MKKMQIHSYKLNLAAVLFFSLIAFTSCGPRIYRSPSLNKARSSHKTIAVIPFDVIIQAKKLPREVTPGMIRTQQEDNGYAIQSDVYSFFLREQSKGKYTVEFQDIDKTNSLISKAGITYEDLRALPKEELAALLGVDAVVSGRVTMSRPMSEGAAIATGVLLGYWGNTHNVAATITIHNKEEGKLLWKYDYNTSGSVGSDSKYLTDVLMRNVSKRFPYSRRS